jgi:hypothetical protein
LKESSNVSVIERAWLLAALAHQQGLHNSTLCCIYSFSA